MDWWWGECPYSTKTRDVLGNPSPPPLRFPSGNLSGLGKSFGRRGWISQYLPRFGGARIQYVIKGHQMFLLWICIAYHCILYMDPSPQRRGSYCDCNLILCPSLPLPHIPHMPPDHFPSLLWLKSEQLWVGKETASNGKWKVASNSWQTTTPSFFYQSEAQLPPAWLKDKTDGCGVLDAVTSPATTTEW